jgi:gliding motility-associated-like protein
MKDQSSLLLYLFREASEKYRKYRFRIEKSIHTGRFQKLSRRKRNSLLHRLKKLTQKVERFYLQLKLAGAGVALTVAASMLNPAAAQTTIGPYEHADRGENVLRGPYRFASRPAPALVDWDQDGDLDLVIGVSGEIHYYEYSTSEKGSGFTERTEANNPFNFLNDYDTYPYSDFVPTFFDYDDDQDLDLFLGTSGNGSDNILYFRNDGGTLVQQNPDEDWNSDTQTGNPFKSLDIGNFNGSKPVVAFIDRDNDGDYDALISQELEATGMYYFRNDAYFDLELEINTISYVAADDDGVPSTGGYDAVPLFADMDADGDLDLIVGGLGGLIYYINDGDNNFDEQEGPFDSGSFTGNPFYEFSFQEPAAPTIGDIDGDGDLDVIIGQPGSFLGEAPAYLENITDPEEPKNLLFAQRHLFDNPMDGYVNPADYTHSWRGSIPAFIDVDNDGDMDVLIGEKYTSTIVYFENENGKYIPAESPLPETVFNTEDPIPAVVDINGDGFLDVFVGMDGNSEPIPPDPSSLLFLNNRDGTFTQASYEDNPLNNVDELASKYEIRLTFIDVDEDYDPDLFVSDGGNDFNFFRNTGAITAPVFQLDNDNDPLLVGLGYKPSLTAIDIDGDSDQDLVVGTQSSGLRVFINEDNSLAFNEVIGPENPLDATDDFYYTAPGFNDIDRDGDLDLFMNIQGGTFEFYRNENPAPMLSTEYNSVEFEINGDPIFINPSFQLTDDDNDEFSLATITIIGYEAGKDMLDYTGVDLSESLDMFFNDESGVLTISRRGTSSDYLTALQGITYQYIEDGDDGSGDQRKKNPAGRTISKTLRFQVFDIDKTTPNHVDFSVTHNNVAPLLSSLTTGITFTSVSGPVTVDNSVTVADDDDPMISSATVSIVGGFQSTEDRLLYTSVPGITGTYLTGTGQLMLTGLAPQGLYATAIRGIQYNNVASFPNSTPRTIEIVANDGEDASAPVSIGVTFNLSPNLSLSQPGISYSGTPIPVDAGITILEDGSTITSAVVSVSTGFIAAEDRLLFTDQSGITGVFDAVAGTLTLTGTATVAAYQTAIRSITYNNLLAVPTTTARIISISIQDGAGNTSNLVSLNVNFTNQNPPALATTVTSTDYVTGSLIVSGDFSVADPDDTQLESASVTISAGFISTEDVLTFSPTSGITGSFNNTTGVLNLIGTAPLADYQTVLRSVTYQNTNTGDRNKTARTLTFRVNDGTDNSNSVNIAVNLPNQVPALANSSTTIQYASGSILVADQVSFTDGDNSSFQSATIQISSGFISSEDILLFTNQNGVTGTFDNSTGTLQLIGSASIANYQTAIRSVRYQNLNAGDRNKNTRTLTVLANDGIANSNATTIALSIPNQTPTLVTGANPPLYGSGSIVLFGGATITDSDNATLQSATASITAGLRSSEDQLVFAAQNGITGSYNPTTGVLQLSGNATKASYETAIRSIQYQNSSANPDANARTITLTINDGITSSTAATITLAINQPPAIVVDEQVTEAGGEVNFDLTTLITDPDNNLDLSNINSITIAAQPTSGAVATLVNGNLVIDYSSVPDFTGIDRLTITICDNLNRCISQEITIQVGAELVVYNAVSPFKDGYNDFLLLRYIDPQNKVTIYNRWGDKVFERVNYDNDDATKRFEGLNDAGEKLASGTYFYKIEYGNALAATGYLTLKQ